MIDVRRHADALRVLEDPARYSSWHGTRPGVTRPADVRAMNNLDGDAHLAARRRLPPMPSPADLEQIIRAAIPDAPIQDAVGDLAEPIARAAVGAWLAIDDAEMRELAALSSASHDAGARASRRARAPRPTRTPRSARSSSGSAPRRRSSSRRACRRSPIRSPARCTRSRALPAAAGARRDGRRGAAPLRVAGEAVRALRWMPARRSSSGSSR